ncbi:MAG: fatty-acid--CoA ligase [Alphaproteobacteria bacterium]|nr:fatty-acid--CoA ligase [Alphaproteobacteria bacterium]
MMTTPLLVPAMLERAGRIFPTGAVVSRLADRSLHRTTYRDVYRRAKALAEGLQSLGLRRGDRVGTLMWNHYAHLEAYFGIPMAGGVLHTLNLRLAPADIAYIVNHAKDRFLIVDDVLLPLLAKFRGEVKLDRVIVVGIGKEPVPAGDIAYEDFLAKASGELAPLVADENEPVSMCYTSGTTGRPKGVVYSHRAIVLHTLATALVDGTGIGHRDTAMPVVPMFHVNAWGIPFTATMIGSNLVMPGPFLDAESLLDLLDRERVTFTAGVPTLWLGVVQKLKEFPNRWTFAPNLRIISGGAAAPESMYRDLESFGVRCFQGWGMTETTPVGSTTLIKRSMPEADVSGDARYQVLTKQGLPLPFIDIRIVNDTGEAPWDGVATGELQLRGPWVAAGYHDNQEGDDKWTADGWFATGDVATVDAEGYIQITDRAKDLIKSGGEWISSVALEGALMDHPAVKEAAVIAIAHPKWQERPLAAVVLKPGATATPTDLNEHLRPRFATWSLPDAYVFIAEIPKTSVGKFQKTKLREMYKDWDWDKAGPRVV